VLRTRRRGDNPISYWSEAVTAFAGPAAEQPYTCYPPGIALERLLEDGSP
jgi:hypothetical protein